MDDVPGWELGGSLGPVFGYLGECAIVVGEEVSPAVRFSAEDMLLGPLPWGGGVPEIAGPVCVLCSSLYMGTPLQPGRIDSNKHRVSNCSTVL